MSQIVITINMVWYFAYCKTSSNIYIYIYIYTLISILLVVSFLRNVKISTRISIL